MAKFEQLFSSVTHYQSAPVLEDYILHGGALAKCFEEIGMVHVSGKNFATWGSASNAAFAPTGDTWSVYKFPDVDQDKRSHNIYVRFSLARANWTFSEGRQMGCRVSVSYGSTFSDSTLLTSYHHHLSSLYAFAYYADSRLVFGFRENSNQTPSFAVHTVERSRARTAWGNDDAFFHGVFAQRTGPEAGDGKDMPVRWTILGRDPLHIYSTLAFVASWSNWSRAQPKPSVAIGPTTANGVSHCQPVYWFNRGVLEQSTTLLGVPSTATPGAEIGVENGAHSFGVRVPRFATPNNVGYSWAYRWE